MITVRGDIICAGYYVDGKLVGVTRLVAYGLLLLYMKEGSSDVKLVSDMKEAKRVIVENGMGPFFREKGGAVLSFAPRLPFSVN